MLSEHNQVSKGQKVVQVRMVVEEKKMVIDNLGTEIWAFTYNGSMPGPMIVAHQNDYIELTLVNASTIQCHTTLTFMPQPGH
jgi:nitrite reductase (NO-forming)